MALSLGSARSKKIMYQLGDVRLLLDNGDYLDIAKQVGGAGLLSVLDMSPAIKDDFARRLMDGEGGHKQLTTDEIGRVAYRLDRVRTNEYYARPLLRAVLGDVFLRVFYVDAIVDETALLGTEASLAS